MAVNEDYVRERLTAYIYPRKPTTAEQSEAFDNAVTAQVEYETANDSANEILGDVTSFSIGNYSESRSGARGADYTLTTICPAAWAYLFNAGLIKHSLPVARRL